MIEIDGSRYSGSGTIVRQGVAFAALTGQAVHIVNARAGRPNPGLRPQHIRVVDAICQVTGGTADGLREGSKELVFRPGAGPERREFLWDIGSAGSATMLALAVLPVLVFHSHSVRVQIRGGLFQDFAPSLFHFQHVLLPLLRRMGVEAHVEMKRPGYVPRGEGELLLETSPVKGVLQPLVLEERGSVDRVWGIALASHLQARRVSQRMAQAVREVLASAGYAAELEIRDEATAAQPGAALAVFAVCSGGMCLGADQAGAPGRPAEAIGRHVGRQLLEELKTGAAVDRFTADQVIPFAALAGGVSRVRVPMMTDHVQSSAWLARVIVGADIEIKDHWLTITGIGFRRAPAQ